MLADPLHAVNARNAASHGGICPRSSLQDERLRHPFRALSLSALLACGEAPPAEIIVPPPSPTLHERVLALGDRVEREVDCAGSPWRWLCAVARVGTGPVQLPAAPTARLGLVTSFRPSQPLLHAAERTATVGLLVLTPELVGFDNLRPTEKLDAKGLGTLAGPLAAFLREGGDPPLLPPVAEPVLALPPVDAGPPEPDAQGLMFHGPQPTDPALSRSEVRLYHLEDAGNGAPAWIAVRGYGEGGFVGVFPDVDPRIRKKVDPPPAEEAP